MRNLRPLSEYIGQIIQTGIAHKETLVFIRKHRLWKGALSNYGWVFRLLILASILVSLKLMSIVINWFGKANVSDPSAALSSVGNLFVEIAQKGSEFMFFGGMKYVMLILLEVVIFHFCRRTLEVLSGQATEMSLNAFIKAQIRMIKVSIRSWIMESIAGILIGIALGMIGFLAFLKTPLIFAVQCYFLGFTIIDNYNEQFGMSIKESAQYSRQFIGVALATGLILYLIMIVPVAGPILGPIISSVAVTILMFKIADLDMVTDDL
jgi:hypothetical protein